MITLVLVAAQGSLSSPATGELFLFGLGAAVVVLPVLAGGPSGWSPRRKRRSPRTGEPERGSADAEPGAGQATPTPMSMPTR